MQGPHDKFFVQQSSPCHETSLDHFRSNGHFENLKDSYECNTSQLFLKSHQGKVKNPKKETNDV